MRKAILWSIVVIAALVLFIWLKQVEDRQRLSEGMVPNPDYVDPGLTTQPNDVAYHDVDPSENPHYAPDLKYRREVVVHYKTLQAIQDSLEQVLKRMQTNRASEHATDVVFYEVFVVCNTKETLFHAMTHEERDSVLIEPGMSEGDLYDKVRIFEQASEFEEVDGFWPTMDQTERDSTEARITRNLQSRGLTMPLY